MVEATRLPPDASSRPAASSTSCALKVAPPGGLPICYYNGNWSSFRWTGFTTKGSFCWRKAGVCDSARAVEGGHCCPHGKRNAPRPCPPRSSRTVGAAWKVDPNETLRIYSHAGGGQQRRLLGGPFLALVEPSLDGLERIVRLLNRRIASSTLKTSCPRWACDTGRSSHEGHDRRRNWRWAKL